MNSGPRGPEAGDARAKPAERSGAVNLREEGIRNLSSDPAIPNCYYRGCIHLGGVKGEPESNSEYFCPEANERFCCKAFPDGIPHDIASGDNLHLEPYPGDHGITFQGKDAGGAV